jgi:hypothetical protein
MRPSPSPDDLRWWLDTNSRTEGDCRVWKRPTTGRASGMRINGILVRAPRIALQLATGKSGDGLHACHSCNNRTCIKGEHLFWGDTSTGTVALKPRRMRKPTWGRVETILR